MTCDLCDLSVTAFGEVPPSKHQRAVKKESIHSGQTRSRSAGPPSHQAGVKAPAGSPCWQRPMPGASSTVCISRTLVCRCSDGFRVQDHRTLLLLHLLLQALSCFIRWDTTGADQVGVREGEEIQEKIPTCLDVRLHSQARVPAPPKRAGQIAGSRTRTKNNHV